MSTYLTFNEVHEYFVLILLSSCSVYVTPQKTRGYISLHHKVLIAFCFYNNILASILLSLSKPVYLCVILRNITIPAVHISVYVYPCLINPTLYVTNAFTRSSICMENTNRLCMKPFVLQQQHFSINNALSLDKPDYLSLLCNKPLYSLCLFIFRVLSYRIYLFIQRTLLQ